MTTATPEHMTYKQSKEAVNTFLAMPHMVNPVEQTTLYRPPPYTAPRKDLSKMEKPQMKRKREVVNNEKHYRAYDYITS
jgi:hypothetical protein